ncbi:MAG: hypothetical protein V1686_00265 [Patescibacteria group bacterium]
MNQELQDYIKKARVAGMNDGQIKQELLKVGWQEQDINQEFSGVSASLPAPISNSIPQETIEREDFSKYVKPEKNNKSKILISIIVLALIAVGVLGYMFLIKPAISKNAGSWETYEDDLYGIQFKYPEALKLVKDTGVSKEFFGGGNAVLRTETFLNLGEYKSEDPLNSSQTVDINVYRNAEVDEIPFLGDCTNMDKISENDISFGNKTAKEMVCGFQIDKYPDIYKDYKGPKVIREYIVKNADFSYFIKTFVCDGESKSDDCNKFISNFKFVESKINLMAFGKIYKQNSDWYLSHMKPGVGYGGFFSYTKEEIKLDIDNAICGETKDTNQLDFDPTKIESISYKDCKEYLAGNAPDEAGIEGTLNGNEIIVKRIILKSSQEILNNSGDQPNQDANKNLTKNCGLIENMRAIVDTDDPYLNTEFNDGFKCMQGALLNDCQMASLDTASTMDGDVIKMFYKIRGKEKESCLISVEIPGMKPSICRIPLNKIPEFKAENDKNEHSDASLFNFVVDGAMKDDPRVICED